MSSEAEAIAVAKPKLTLKQQLQLLMADFGKIAIYTYLVLSLATIAAFSVAFGFGMAPTSASGVGGVIFAGWVAAKATMPLRILATLGLTPLVATLLRRHKRPSDDDDD